MIPKPNGRRADASWMAGARAQIDQFLDSVMPPEDEAPPLLHAAMRYSVFSGGKRLRPLLCMASYEAVALRAGARPERPDLQRTPPWLWPAAAVELVHCYSLIHDDLPCMDDDDFRRGRPSCHRAFDEATALLAGDALLTMAFAVLGDARFVEAMNAAAAAATAAADPAGPGASLALACVRELSGAAGSLGMVGGQAAEFASTTGADPWPKTAGPQEAAERIVAIQELKTGKLFQAAVRMGAIAAGAEHDVLQALTRFARSYGRAFQIRDDIEDADTQDAAAGTLTSVTLGGAEAARTEMARLALEARKTALDLGAAGCKLVSIVDLTFPEAVDADV